LLSLQGLTIVYPVRIIAATKKESADQKVGEPGGISQPRIASTIQIHLFLFKESLPLSKGKDSLLFFK